MPARRSRTLEWRRCLEQVQQRGGAIEIAVLRDYDRPAETAGSHLVWRVRLLEVTCDEIIVEPPTTLGEVIRVETGINLVAVLADEPKRLTIQRAARRFDFGKDFSESSRGRIAAGRVLQMGNVG